MKKTLLNIIIILICTIIPYNVQALSTTVAKEEIDINKEVSLTLNYTYGDYNFDNTNVKIYYIASITKDFQYQLSSDFLDYKPNINGTKTIAELNYITKTLSTYIIDNNIEPVLNSTIQNNKIVIDDLKQGLYLINTAKISTEKSTIIFENNLINIPNLKEDGTWDYEIEIFQKAEEQFKEDYNPDTGDDISLYFYLLAFSLLGIIILIVSFIFKKFNNRYTS